jgi:hypothetical protein
LRIFVLPFIKVVRIGSVFTIAHAEDAAALGTIFTPYRKKSHQDKSRQKKELFHLSSLPKPLQKTCPFE